MGSTLLILGAVQWIGKETICPLTLRRFVGMIGMAKVLVGQISLEYLMSQPATRKTYGYSQNRMGEINYISQTVGKGNPS